jgi:hypothetical protein
MRESKKIIMTNLHIEDINPEVVSAYQHASITQQRHIKKLLEYLILQQTQLLQRTTPKTAYAFLNDDVWDDNAPADLADNHDHYLYNKP